MAKTKQIKTIVYTEDYQKLSAIARLNNRKIWQEIALAIKNHISKYAFTTPEPTEPETANIKSAETLAEEEKNTDIKQKIKICADSLNLQYDDFSDSSYEKCKEFMEKVLNKELSPRDIDKSLFDQAQIERRQEANGNKKRTII